MKILTIFVLYIRYITNDSEAKLVWTEEGLFSFRHCREHHKVGAKNLVMWPCIVLKRLQYVSAFEFTLIYFLLVHLGSTYYFMIDML